MGDRNNNNRPIGWGIVGGMIVPPNWRTTNKYIKSMTQEEKDYLLWRCKTSWHNKYHQYINEWIDNVLLTQLEYFRKEMNNLINRGIYETRR